jgi:hypothetical protein
VSHLVAVSVERPARPGEVNDQGASASHVGCTILLDSDPEAAVAPLTLLQRLALDRLDCPVADLTWSAHPVPYA